jgi:hydroxymethylpyrimidine pyrophosphatase-like HAD family hydrolase
MTEALRRQGARVAQSSVHLHATFDAADKATGLARHFEEHLGVDASIARARVAFVGDSGNDAPCFMSLVTTIGVANVRRHAAQLVALPRYVTQAEMGAGFAEFVRHFLQLRG